MRSIEYDVTLRKYVDTSTWCIGNVVVVQELATISCRSFSCDFDPHLVVYTSGANFEL